MTILVTGSTGTIGAQVLAHLDGGGATVRALTRSPERARFPDRVAAVRGDLSDVDSTRAAMRGIDTLFLLVSNTPDELTQAIAALNVARDANVKGIVYFSVIRSDEYVDVPHFAAKRTVERMIDACALPATVLRPAYFMQNDERQKEALLGQGVYAMPVGRRGVSMVDTRDIGDAAARLWSEVLGRPIRYGGDDLDVFEQRLRTSSPAWLADDMRQMMRRYQEDGAVPDADEVRRFEQLLGRPPRSYRAFAEEAAAGWT